MRILYDGRAFQFQRVGGINRIFAEVISGLPADYHPLVTGVEDFGKNAPRHRNLKQPQFTAFRPGRISNRVREHWWKPRLLAGLDLFHPTYYDLTAGYSFSDFKCPIVLTAYDFIHANYPKLIEGSEREIRHQTDAIRKADFVVCISKATLAITSNTTSMPEVVGDRGIMLDPTREQDWTECILKTARGGGDRDLIVKRGLERVGLFSWKKTVDQHLRIYRQLG